MMDLPTPKLSMANPFLNKNKATRQFICLEGLFKGKR